MGPDKEFTRHLELFKKIRNKQTEHLWNGLQVGKLHQFSFSLNIIVQIDVLEAEESV